jgi:hypothetical protein
MNRNKLIEKISAAFGNTSLEDGIGILECEAIDFLTRLFQNITQPCVSWMRRDYDSTCRLI